jgi:membrane-associated protease RseP (regulator of RpoE activity)
MIYMLLGLLGVALLVVLNAGAVLAGRMAAARLLRLRGVPFWPLGAPQRGTPVARWKQAVSVAVGFAAAYLVAACFYAGALRANGRTVEDPEARAARVLPVVGSSADRAGIQPGDQVVAVADEPIARWADLAPALKRRAGQTAELGIARGTEALRVPVPISPDGRIGVIALPERRAVGLGEALSEGLAQPWRAARKVFQQVGAERADMSGPVRFAAEASATDGWLRGFQFLAWLDASYGLVLAVVFAVLARVRILPEGAG